MSREFPRRKLSLKELSKLLEGYATDGAGGIEIKETIEALILLNVLDQNSVILPDRESSDEVV
jgi:hypothetical protein